MESSRNPSPPRYTGLVFDHFPMATALFDTQDLRLLLANTRFYALLDSSWQDGRAVGHSLSTFVPGWFPQSQVPTLQAIFHRVAQTHTPYQKYEQALVLPGGGTTYWNWTLDPIGEQEGRVTRLLLTVCEVTQYVQRRQRDEEAQPAYQQEHNGEFSQLEVIEFVGRKVRETLETKTVSMAAVEAIRTHFDPLYVYTHIADPSHSVLRLLHIRPVPEKSALRVVQRVSYDGPYPLANAHKQRDPIIIDDLQTDEYSAAREHFPLVAGEGHGYVCVPLWFGEQFEGTLTAIFKHPIASKSAQVQALIGSGTHLAAALAHARLHASVENERTRLRTILDELPEGVVIVEADDGHISYANTAASLILSTPVEQLVGAPLHSYPLTHLVTTPDSEPVLPWNFTVIHALSGETIQSQETLVIRPDGSHVLLLSSAAPLRLETGVVTGASIVFQDITARKTLEEHKNEFLSIASHELRTPVTAILGFAELLHEQVAQEQQFDTFQLRAIANIREQSHLLSHLIEEMLDMSHLDYAYFTLHTAPHDLLKMLLSIIEDASSLATPPTNHSIRLVLKGLQPTDTLLCRFDEVRMRQTLQNLISNARKYSPSGGDIEVGLQHHQGQPDEVLIWVKDSGIGIPADELPRIFERFHRADNADRSISGFGLGLYLAKEVVTRHRGLIWAESTEGSGSTFYIRLPLIL